MSLYDFFEDGSNESMSQMEGKDEEEDYSSRNVEDILDKEQDLFKPEHDVEENNRITRNQPVYEQFGAPSMVYPHAYYVHRTSHSGNDEVFDYVRKCHLNFPSRGRGKKIRTEIDDFYQKRDLDLNQFFASSFFGNPLAFGNCLNVVSVIPKSSTEPIYFILHPSGRLLDDLSISRLRLPFENENENGRNTENEQSISERNISTISIGQRIQQITPFGSKESEPVILKSSTLFRYFIVRTEKCHFVVSCLILSDDDNNDQRIELKISSRWGCCSKPTSTKFLSPNLKLQEEKLGVRSTLDCTGFSPYSCDDDLFSCTYTPHSFAYIESQLFQTFIPKYNGPTSTKRAKRVDLLRQKNAQWESLNKNNDNTMFYHYEGDISYHENAIIKKYYSFLRNDNSDADLQERDNNHIYHVICDNNSGGTIHKHTFHRLTNLKLVEFTTHHPMLVWCAASSTLAPYGNRDASSSLYILDLRCNQSSFCFSPSNSNYFMEGAIGISAIYPLRKQNEHALYVMANFGRQLFELDARMPGRQMQELNAWKLSGIAEDKKYFGVHAGNDLLSFFKTPQEEGLGINVLSISQRVGAYGLCLHQPPLFESKFHTDSLETGMFYNACRRDSSSSTLHESVLSSSVYPLVDQLHEKIFHIGLESICVPFPTSKTNIHKHVEDGRHLVFGLTMNNLGDIYCHPLLSCNRDQTHLNGSNDYRSQVQEGLPFGSRVIPVPSSFEINNESCNTEEQIIGNMDKKLYTFLQQHGNDQHQYKHELHIELSNHYPISGAAYFYPERQELSKPNASSIPIDLDSIKKDEPKEDKNITDITHNLHEQIEGMSLQKIEDDKDEETMSPIVTFDTANDKKYTSPMYMDLGRKSGEEHSKSILDVLSNVTKHKASIDEGDFTVDNSSSDITPNKLLRFETLWGTSDL